MILIKTTIYIWLFFLITPARIYIIIISFCFICFCLNPKQTIESIPVSRSDNSLETRGHDRVDSAAIARMPRSLSADFSPPSYSTICESSDETFEPEGTARSRVMPIRKTAAALRQKSVQPRSNRANSRKPKPMDCGDIDVLEWSWRTPGRFNFYHNAITLSLCAASVCFEARRLIKGRILLVPQQYTF